MLKFLKATIFILAIVQITGCTNSDNNQSNSITANTFYRELKAEPGSLNPFSYTDLYASHVHSYVLDTLLTRNENTYKWQPLLAKSWSENKDSKEITFKLRKGIQFHNGEELTAEDVKFSFDAIKNPDYKAARLMPYYENISEAVVVDPYTIKFKIKKKYFGNLNVLGSLSVVPKSFYGNPKKRHNKVLVGSGAYKLHKYNRGRSIILKRNPDWFGHKLEEFKDFNNFQQIFFRFVKDNNIALEMLKKGELDYLETMQPELFVKQAVGKPWGKTALKQKVKNLTPKSYNYIGFNLKLDLFKSRRVRLALTHLMNREMMIKKFRYNLDYRRLGPGTSKALMLLKKQKFLSLILKKLPTC